MACEDFWGATECADDKTTCGPDHEGDSKIPRTLATWGVATPMGFEHTLHYVIFVGFFFGFFCWQDMVLKLGVGWVGIAILPVNW